MAVLGYELYRYVGAVSSSKPLPFSRCCRYGVAVRQCAGLEDKMGIELPVELLKREDGVPWESGRTRQVVVPGRIQRRT